MADELIDPLKDLSPVGDALKIGTVPSDLGSRPNLQNAIFPRFLDTSSSVELVTAPDPSTQAVLAGAAETYDLSELPELELIVDDYEGAKRAPGTPGVLLGGSFPGTTTTNTVNDQLTVALHGEVGQAIDVGTQTSGAAIAAAIQAAVRALTAASAVNQQAYDGFLAEYVASSFSTTLATALPIGQFTEMELASVAGLQSGDVLRVVDSTGPLEPPFNVTVLKVDYTNSSVLVTAHTNTQIVQAGSTVYVPDDHYLLTSGKRGNDSSVVVTAGVADAAAGLKLTVATGAVSSSGTDAIGKQKVVFDAADFVDPALATAAEVAVVINRTVTGLIASAPGGTITLTSRKYGRSANLRALAGDATTALGFATDIEVGTNTDITLRQTGVTLDTVQRVNAGVPGNYISTAGFRVEGDKLVNVDATDHAAVSSDLSVTYTPTLRG